MQFNRPWRFGRLLSAVAVVWVVFALVGCDKSEDSVGDKTRLEVFAASSLTEAFKDIESSFEVAHPGVDVALNFSGSQVLRIQLEQGASADVFASANPKHMAALVEAEIVASSAIFAHNELVVIVPRDNPAGLDSFEDLSDAERVVIGTDNVPVGIYTRQMFEKARAALGEDFVANILDDVASEESNVRLVRAKVDMGEADAAIVYRTDAASSGRVGIVEIPPEFNVRASYAIGGVVFGAEPELGQKFVDFVRSSQGRDILGRRGFVTDVE